MRLTKVMVMAVTKPRVVLASVDPYWEVTVLQPIQLPDYQDRNTGEWKRPKVIRKGHSVFLKIIPAIHSWIEVNLL